jgi:hypothetical protein
MRSDDGGAGGSRARAPRRRAPVDPLAERPAARGEALAEAAGDRRDRGRHGVVGPGGEREHGGAHGRLVAREALLPAGELRPQLLVAAGGGQRCRVPEQRHAVLDVEQRVAQRLVGFEQVVGRHRAGARHAARERGGGSGRDVACGGDGLELREHRARVRRAGGQQCGLRAPELAPEALPVGPKLGAEDAQLAQRAVLTGVHATEYGRISRRDRRRAPPRRGRPRRCARSPGRACPT